MFRAAFACVDPVGGFGRPDLMVEGVELVEVLTVFVFPAATGRREWLEALEFGVQFGEFLGMTVDVGFEAGDAAFEFFAFGPVGVSADGAEVADHRVCSFEPPPCAAAPVLLRADSLGDTPVVPRRVDGPTAQAVAEMVAFVPELFERPGLRAGLVDGKVFGAAASDGVSDRVEGAASTSMAWRSSTRRSSATTYNSLWWRPLERAI